MRSATQARSEISQLFVTIDAPMLTVSAGSVDNELEYMMATTGDATMSDALPPAGHEREERRKFT